MPKPTAILQLKVTLRGSRPPIWRRVLVPADVTLAQLHEILQLAMGWTDSHLHQFVARGVCYGSPDPDFGIDRKDERRVRLGNVLSVPKVRMVYEYDFGDGWEHEVVVEKVLPPEPGGRYPWVVAGKRACPPEDCGGVFGYEQLLEALRNPAHPEHEDMMEWTGGELDPEAFDPEEVNLVLHSDLRSGRPD
jgi:hypothetical protein